MIRDTFENIVNGTEVRQNLIQLKTELKDPYNKTALLFQLSGDYTIFYSLLTKEDAKVRKNTAMIMGELGVQQFLNPLYEAYCKEETLFVKSSYLDAMMNLDYSKLLPAFKARLKELGNISDQDSNYKHFNDEIRSLTSLIIQVEGLVNHTFTGYDISSELILLTNRNYQRITRDQLQKYQSKEFNAGVMVKTDNLKDILPIRTYEELLFMLPDSKTVNMDVDAAANAIASSSLFDFLKIRHEGSEPFYFRIEIKSKLDLDKKSIYTKKLASKIEQLTNRKLINSTSNYEFELRLIENKEGKYNLLIKLYTIKVKRFSYRKQSIATSIRPVDAALMAALAKDYLKEGAQVLDPFCGVGTMLIERNMLVKASTMYGLDIYREAIEKAKENTEAANLMIHYINRDFFDFKHDYLFDEIFTNMPRAMGHKEEDEIYHLYKKFFEKTPELLKKGGVMVLYSHNKDYVKKLINRTRFQLEKEFELSKKAGAYLFIIKYLE